MTVCTYQAEATINSESAVRQFLDAEKDTPEKLAQAILDRWWGKMDKAIRALEVLAEIQDENGQDTKSKVTLAALHIIRRDQ